MQAIHGHESRHGRSHYAGLAWMAVLSFVAMYVLMYAMVDRVHNVYSNLNQVYMAGLMAMPMVVAVAFWFGIREQGGITERQFLKSMIPHHASAILMCKRAELTDPEGLELCRRIIASQRSETEQMKAMLEG
ncbi:MAG: DUF305 domain-containing protein [Steroidobacteraceae bacterium]